MPATSQAVTMRSFRRGDGAALAAAWTDAAPTDGITAHRFRDLFLLDRNFDASGLFVAETGGNLVGSAYAVRRRIAQDADDLEPSSGWIPYFFVHPEAAGQGIGRTLVSAALDWLHDHGTTTVYFSSYTPNYFLPGLDIVRYPAAAKLLTSLGFTTQYQSVAMDYSLNDHTTPQRVRALISDLRGQGYILRSPTDDDLVDLIDIAGQFNSDWSRAIREAVLNALPLERILTARHPSGAMLGWAMHGTYEHVLERFGPFGVLPEARGTGLGEVLLHLTLERMRAFGAHSAWFLWTDEDSPAGHLYTKTGFTITRKFSILHHQLDDPASEPDRHH